MTIVTAQRATAQRDTTMAMGDDDNDVNGDGTTGNKVDVDSGGATSDDNGVDDNGYDDDDGNSKGAMVSSATGYDDDNDGHGRRRQRRW